ncbi:MAG: hypothetical protein QXX08_00705 [Candidatus Bathyarchaeia archaeon]
MDKIDELLEFLAMNRRSFTLGEISKSVNIPCVLCNDLIYFLANYNFVQLNHAKEVEINPKIRRFIDATSNKSFHAKIHITDLKKEF